MNYENYENADIRGTAIEASYLLVCIASTA